jgi:hypothetical protein
MYCFFPVISDPTQAHKVEVAMVSCHRINGPFDPPPEGWVLDSGGYKQRPFCSKRTKTGGLLGAQTSRSGLRPVRLDSSSMSKRYFP